MKAVCGWDKPCDAEYAAALANGEMRPNSVNNIGVCAHCPDDPDSEKATKYNPYGKGRGNRYCRECTGFKVKRGFANPAGKRVVWICGDMACWNWHNVGLHQGGNPFTKRPKDWRFPWSDEAEEQAD